MSLQIASRGPVERGFVVVALASETQVPIAGEAGLCHKNLDVRLIFGIPSWLTPLRDHSGQSSQPFRQGTR